MAYFYVVREFGGAQFDINGTDVYCISRQTPMAQALFGHIVGDGFVMNDITYIVKEIL